MKLRVISVLLCWGLLLGLVGCTQAPVESPPDPSVGVMFYSGKRPSGSMPVEEILDQKTDVVSCKWNILDGTMEFGDKPVFTFRDSTSYAIALWDGADHILANVDYELIDQDYDIEPSVSILELSDGLVLYGDNYYLDLLDGVATLTLDSGEQFAFSDVNGPTIGDSPVTLENSRDSILAGEYSDGVLTIAFFHNSWEDPRASKLVYAKLDTADGAVTWSQPVDVPDETIHGITRFPESSQAAIVNHKLYFTGAEALGCLDLEIGQSNALTDVSATLDKLIPNSYRPSTYGLLTQVSGYNKDVVIGYVSYSSKENDIIYDVEYAVWNNQLLGGFYVTSPVDGFGEFTTITTFDGDLNLLNTLSPKDLGFDAFQGIVVEKHHRGRYN